MRRQRGGRKMDIENYKLSSTSEHVTLTVNGGIRL